MEFVIVKNKFYKEINKKQFKFNNFYSQNQFIFITY